MNNPVKKNNTAGFTIVETIIYFTMLSIITVLVIGSIISLFKNYNIIRANQQIENNAVTIIDKLTRDVRSARSVVTAQSSFGIPLGILTLDIASSTNDTASTSVKLYLTGNKIRYAQNGVDIGNLSTSEVSISNFKIYYIGASSTEALKVELGIDSISHLNSTTTSKNFYTTIQLRE